MRGSSATKRSSDRKEVAKNKHSSSDPRREGKKHKNIIEDIHQDDEDSDVDAMNQQGDENDTKDEDVSDDDGGQR